jgi:hypothetical protein
LGWGVKVRMVKTDERHDDAAAAEER